MDDNLDPIEEQEAEKDWDDSWDEDDLGREFTLDWSHNQSWVWGVVLIVLGFLFVLSNFNILPMAMHNWWAVFILVPGINMLTHAYRRFQEVGQITARARRSAFTGAFLVALSITFLFNISWAIIGPVFLIVAGLYILLIR